jgi:hypothetical protein
MKEGLSPEIIRPFPKARPRKTGGRKRGKTRILTDTPERNKIGGEKKKKRKSFIFGDLAQGDFVLVKLAGKKSIFHYIAEAMNDFDRNEYEIRYYKWIENTNNFIFDKEN